MPETVNRITANFDGNLYVDLIRITKPETLENKHIIPLKIKIVFLKGSKTQQGFRRPERSVSVIPRFFSRYPVGLFGPDLVQ